MKDFRKRAEHHFQHVLDLRADRRAAYLESACTDPGLRSEVELLLAAYEGVEQSFLDSPISFTAPPEEPNEASPATIGPYEIRGELGRGGMGIVYRAYDSRLDRDVALKVLTPDAAEDVEWLRRFRREARLLAAMNHPNIATIHSLEEADGVTFLTLELVEGVTLAGKLDAPLDSRLHLARQIAGAVEAAHGRGVVHRDLKPANILVMRDERVKVLDFGLALTVDGANPAATASQLVAGTPGYMSPEQLRGEATDPRTDVWAFGAVLYELFSGHRAFEGATVAECAAATLERDPDWNRLEDNVPERFRTLIAHCLVRSISERLGSMTDARLAIEHTIAERALPRSDSTPAASAHSSLPVRLTSFVGRQSELKSLDELLDDCRLITLTGAGGGGKSRLALEVAKTHASRFPAGVWFVELAAVSMGPAVALAVATAMDLEDSIDAELSPTIASVIGDRRGLLVLDNCEHVLEPAAGLATRLLEACPSLVLIATSRETLGVPGEQTYPVPTMSADGPALFRERARATVPTFEIDEGNRAVVESICRRLDGLPLAIELAAARVNVLSPSDILQRLDDRFRLLTSGTAQSLPRHRTLRALIDWSFEQLDPGERLLFGRLATFVGGWTLEAAESVCTGGDIETWDVLDMLSRLVDKSLVVVNAEPRVPSKVRYSFLETIRAYAGDTVSDPEAWSTRHRAYFGAFADEADSRMVTDRATWLPRVAVDYDNFSAALDRGEATPTRADVLYIAGALVRYHEARGRWSEGRRIGERVLAWPGVRELQTEGVARLVHRVGTIAYHQSDNTADAWLIDAYARWEALGDRRGMAGILNNRGLVALSGGDFELAVQRFRAAQDINREIGNEAWEASNLHNIGFALDESGKPKEARPYVEQALEIIRRIGDVGVECSVLNTLARVVDDAGDPDGAEPIYQECLDLCVRIGHDAGASTARLNLSTLYIERGELDRAQDTVLESLRMKREIGDRGGLVNCIETISSIEGRRGNIERSVRLVAAAAHDREIHSNPLTPIMAEARATWREDVRASLGSEAFDREWAAGARRRIEDLVDELLR